MRKFLGLLVALAIVASLPTTALATKVKLKGKGAAIHDIVLSSNPDVEVIAPYKRSIKLHRLRTNEVAYWIPQGGKYISAGKYAYLWCHIIKKKSGRSSYHWVPIQIDALHKAMGVGHQYEGGVAFYQLTYDGKVIHFKAYLYNALHAAAEGEKIITVRE